MKKLKLASFLLEEYDESIIDHKIVAIKLDNENSFLGCVTRHIEKLNENKLKNDCAYVAYYNDTPIGFISIRALKENYEIRYGILPEYRNQHLGTLLLKEFSNKMFENPNISELNIFINSANIASRKLALQVGYEKVTSVKYKMNK